MLGGNDKKKIATTHVVHEMELIPQILIINFLIMFSHIFSVQTDLFIQEECNEVT